MREWSTSAFCWQYQCTSSLSLWTKQTVRNNEVSESSGCPQSRVWLKISLWKELTWHLPDGYNRISEEYYSSLAPATAGLLLSLKNTKHIEAQLAYRDKHWSANWEVTNLNLCRGRLIWKVDNTVYWINLYPLHNILVFLILDHCIVIYLVDSTVQCLNNWDKTNTQGLKITEENENVLS